MAIAKRGQTDLVLETIRMSIVLCYKGFDKNSTFIQFDKANKGHYIDYLT